VAYPAPCRRNWLLRANSAERNDREVSRPMLEGYSASAKSKILQELHARWLFRFVSVVTFACRVTVILGIGTPNRERLWRTGDFARPMESRALLKPALRNLAAVANLANLREIRFELRVTCCQLGNPTFRATSSLLHFSGEPRLESSGELFLLVLSAVEPLPFVGGQRPFAVLPASWPSHRQLAHRSHI
jgi:hypothetical protein